MARALPTRERSGLRKAADSSTAKHTGTTLRPKRAKNAPKAAVPKKENRNRNKPVTDGLNVEEKMLKLLKRHGIHAWRNPGQRGVNLATGRGYRPDMATQIGGLGKYGVRTVVSATKQPKPSANVVIEVKSQHTTGSADQKISGAILTLARMADEHDVAPVMILDTKVHTKAQIEKFRAEARMHLVAFVTPYQIRKGETLAQIEQVAKSRQALKAKLNAKGQVRREHAANQHMFLRAYRYRLMAAGNIR